MWLGRWLIYSCGGLTKGETLFRRMMACAAGGRLARCVPDLVERTGCLPSVGYELQLAGNGRTLARSL